MFAGSPSDTDRQKIHIQQMQDYFSQYIEEYYEEENDDVVSPSTQKPKAEYDAEYK